MPFWLDIAAFLVKAVILVAAVGASSSSSRGSCAPVRTRTRAGDQGPIAE